MRLVNQLLLVATLTLSAQSLPAAPADDFRSLLEEAWQWRLQAYPVFASRLGDRRFNAEWADLSVAAHDRRNQEATRFPDPPARDRRRSTQHRRPPELQPVQARPRRRLGGAPFQQPSNADEPAGAGCRRSSPQRKGCG